MALIAGWFDPAGIADPDASLAAMAAVRHGLPCPFARAEATATAALSIAGDPAEVAFLREGDLWVAVAGQPHWRDGALEALARTKGHGAAVLEAYRRHGADLMDDVHGHATLIVIDGGRRAVVGAIDRAGVGRLCFATPRPGTVVFGTSADAVARHPAVQAGLSDQGLFDFLAFYAVPCPTTIYRGVGKLRPGELFHGGAEGIAVRTYWRMPYGEGARETRADALAEGLRQVLRAATRRAMAGEPSPKLGAYLSGGLDSSTVAGLYATEAGGRAHTFTIGFAEKGYDERAFARVAAEHFHTDHVEYVLTPEDAVALLPRLAEAYDEPFANTSAIPAFYCARRAAEAGVATMLAGDGGDELFAGNARYLTMMRMERHHAPARLAAPLVSALPMGGAALTRKVRDRIRRLALPLPLRMHYGPLDDLADASALLSRDFLASVDRHHPAAIMTEVYERTIGGDPVNAMMHHDLQLTLADNDLRKVVRMAELAGVRVRFPMLDDDVMAFAARVPPALLLAGDELRAFYKRAMTGFLPPETLAKTKHGFGMPFDLWSRTHAGYRAFCVDHVRAFARRGILAPAAATAVVVDLEGGTATHPATAMAIDLALLEAWLARRGL